MDMVANHPPAAIGFKAKIGLVTFSIILSLVFIELGLAFFLPQQTYNSVKATTRRGYRESEWLILELEPNYQGAEVSVEGGVNRPYLIQTNSLGFRDEEFSVEKPPDTYRIMIMGDSFTFGVPVDNGQDYPARLEACLSSHLYGAERYEVINAGYASGFAPDSYYVFLREIAPPYEPDMVIAAYFVLNDFLDLLDSEWVNVQNGLPERVRSKTRILNLQGQFTYRDTLPRYRVPVLRNSHTFQLLMEFLTEHSETLEGNVPAFYQDMSLFNQVYLPQLPPEMDSMFDKSLLMLQAMDDLSRADNADFAFMTLLIPSGTQVSPVWWADEVALPYPESLNDMYPQKALHEFLDDNQILYIDLLPTFAGKPEYYLESQGHWTVEGYQVAADALCQQLIDGQLAAHRLDPSIEGVKGIIDPADNTLRLYVHQEGVDCDQIAALTGESLPEVRATEPNACGWYVELNPADDLRYEVVVFSEAGQEDQFVIRLDEGGALFFEVVASTDLAASLMPNTQNDYENYVQNAEHLIGDGIVYNPSTGELADRDKLSRELQLYVEFAYSRDADPQAMNSLYELLYVFEQSRFGNELSDEQSESLVTWQNTLLPGYLQDAGIGYVFIPYAWYGWLTPEEAQILDDSQHYELLQMWQEDLPAPYLLYRVVGDAR